MLECQADECLVGNQSSNEKCVDLKPDVKYQCIPKTKILIYQMRTPEGLRCRTFFP